MRHERVIEARAVCRDGDGALLLVAGELPGGLVGLGEDPAEVVAALMRAHYGSAMLIAASHLAGSLAATALGIYCVRAVT